MGSIHSGNAGNVLLCTGKGATSEDVMPRVMPKIRDSIIDPSKNLSLFGGVGVPLRSSGASLALEV